jgi:hypothetical protein
VLLGPWSGAHFWIGEISYRACNGLLKQSSCPLTKVIFPFLLTSTPSGYRKEDRNLNSFLKLQLRKKISLEK